MLEMKLVQKCHVHGAAGPYLITDKSNVNEPPTVFGGYKTIILRFPL